MSTSTHSVKKEKEKNEPHSSSKDQYTVHLTKQHLLLVFHSKLMFKLNYTIWRGAKVAKLAVVDKRHLQDWLLHLPYRIHKQNWPHLEWGRSIPYYGLELASGSEEVVEVVVDLRSSSMMPPSSRRADSLPNMKPYLQQKQQVSGVGDLTCSEREFAGDTGLYIRLC